MLGHDVVVVGSDPTTCICLSCPSLSPCCCTPPRLGQGLGETPDRIPTILNTPTFEFGGSLAVAAYGDAGDRTRPKNRDSVCAYAVGRYCAVENDSK